MALIGIARSIDIGLPDSKFLHAPLPSEKILCSIYIYICFYCSTNILFRHSSKTVDASLGSSGIRFLVRVSHSWSATACTDPAPGALEDCLGPA